MRSLPEISDSTDVALPAIQWTDHVGVKGLPIARQLDHIWVIVIRKAPVQMAPAIIKRDAGAVLTFSGVAAKDCGPVAPPADDPGMRCRVIVAVVEAGSAEGVSMVVVIGAHADVGHAAVRLARLLDGRAAIIFVWVDRYTVDRHSDSTRLRQSHVWQLSINFVGAAVLEQRVGERHLERLELVHERARHALVIVTARSAAAGRPRHAIEVGVVVRHAVGMDDQELIVAVGGLDPGW